MSEIDSGTNDLRTGPSDGVVSPRRQSVRGRSRRARRSKGRNWGLIAAAVLVLAVAGFLVFKAVGPKAAKTTYVTQSATTGTLTVAVVSQRQRGQRELLGGRPRRLRDGDRSRAFRSAAHVKKGDTLFVIENPDLGRQRGAGPGLVPECAVVGGQGQAEQRRRRA